MRNKDVYKALLSGIQIAVKTTNDEEFTQQLVESLSNQVQPIADFFGIDDDESIVMAYFLNAHINDSEPDRECIVKHFGKDISALADVYEIIEKLVERKLLMMKGSNMRRSKQNFKNVLAHPRAIMAMSEGDAELLNFHPSKNFHDFLLEVNDLLIQRIRELINTMSLFEEVDTLMEVNKEMPEVRWLLSQKELRSEDLLIFLNICVEHSNGEDEVDMDKMTREVFDCVSERMIYKQKIKMGKCILYTKDYIESSGSQFAMYNMVQLSDELMNKMFGQMNDIAKKEFKPRMGVLINCENIKDEKLFYNEKEAKQISTLLKALDHTNYKELSKKLTSNNMLAGFTVLMHGYPGTGKTSSVKSIAKQTGRHIFMIEIPKVHSKWVGESEKNLSKVFKEYRESRKHFDNDPILLFNEADALLGKRFNVNNSVDQMNNSLQNILLQELEDFEGIFIATTNLVNHLDSAFDRRLLYKLEFQKPEEEVRYRILKSSFPDFDENVLQDINQDYQLTGGQISNIKKKMMVKEMLESELDADDVLLTLCEEEFSLRNVGRGNVIGFKRGIQPGTRD